MEIQNDSLDLGCHPETKLEAAQGSFCAEEWKVVVYCAIT